MGMCFTKATHVLKLSGKVKNFVSQHFKECCLSNCGDKDKVAVFAQHVFFGLFRHKY